MKHRSMVTNGDTTRGSGSELYTQYGHSLSLLDFFLPNYTGQLLKFQAFSPLRFAKIYCRVLGDMHKGRCTPCGATHQSLPCVKGGAPKGRRDCLRKCLHFLFNSEKKVRKKTPHETHGFVTSFNAPTPTHNATIPRVDFCGKKLRLNVASPLLLTRSAAHCHENVEVGAKEAFCQL